MGKACKKRKGYGGDYEEGRRDPDYVSRTTSFVEMVTTDGVVLKNHTDASNYANRKLLARREYDKLYKKKLILKEKALSDMSASDSSCSKVRFCFFFFFGAHLVYFQIQKTQRFFTCFCCLSVLRRRRKWLMHHSRRLQ